MYIYNSKQITKAKQLLCKIKHSLFEHFIYQIDNADRNNVMEFFSIFCLFLSMIDIMQPQQAFSKNIFLF